MIRITLHPPRCYVLGRRLHHGAIGLVLMIHDRRDIRIWVRDFLTGR